MFLPSNNKKFVNISIVTLKINGFKFELAVYPNKLYEYFNKDGNMDLNMILHSKIIYKNISRGDECSKSDLEYLQNHIRDKYKIIRNVDDSSELIHFILKNGYERKPSKTKDVEQKMIENQVMDILHNKVMLNKAYLNKNVLLKIVKGMWNFNNSDSAKKQATDIIRKLEKIGFERVSYIVTVEDADCVGCDEYEKYKTDIKNEYLLKRDILHNFIKECDLKGIKYSILKHEEVESEEIC